MQASFKENMGTSGRLVPLASTVKTNVVAPKGKRLARELVDFRVGRHLALGPTVVLVWAKVRHGQDRAKSLPPSRATLVFATPIPLYCPVAQRAKSTMFRAAMAQIFVPDEKKPVAAGEPISLSTWYFRVSTKRLQSVARPPEIRIQWSIPSPSNKWCGPRGPNCGFGPFRMYAPSRARGRAPSATLQAVGGSSATGAKFPARTSFGSSGGGSTGGSRCLWMSSSKESKSRASGGGRLVFSRAEILRSIFAGRGFWARFSRAAVLGSIFAGRGFDVSAALQVTKVVRAVRGFGWR
ncbi:ARM repeat superfamily protein [Striga asiatica]|uniref:ARM repeat superfamily protein n=1 Tax=Striga asiatica TaxID=4170 RepID=A0A5A7PCT5_STRAF|nr:ARM repeat superfamily protein [Striga asiatica]